METIARITEWIEVDALPLGSRHAFDFALGRLAEVRAPQAGLVAAVRRCVSVNPGERVVRLFRVITP